MYLLVYFIISLIINVFCIYLIYRLSKYIDKYEAKVQSLSELVKNVKQSLEELSPQGLIKPNGKVNKKTYF